jgi:hypothetical protein
MEIKFPLIKRTDKHVKIKFSLDNYILNVRVSIIIYIINTSY